MNKKNIIDLLHKYNFDSDKYLVISGAAMVLLGLKEQTSDIDIAVTEDYYEYLLDHYDCTFERINEYGKKVYFIDNIINFSTSYYTDDKIIINEIPIQKPKNILKLKKSLNREKDKIDIERIKVFIENEK